MKFEAEGNRLLLWNLEWALVYDMATRSLVRPPIKNDPLGMYNAWLSGHRLISTNIDFTAMVVDLASGKPLHPPLKHGGQVISAGLVAGGTVFFTNSVDGLFRLWDLQSGRLLAEPTFKQEQFAPAGCSPDGKTVAIFPASATGFRLRVGAGPATPLILPRADVIKLWQFAAEPPARALFLTSTEAKAIDIASGRIGPGGFTFPEPNTGALGRDKDTKTLGNGHTLVVQTGPIDQPIVWRIWRLGADQIVHDVVLQDPPLVPPGYSGLWGFDAKPNGKYFTTAYTDGGRVVGVWDLKSGRRVTTISTGSQFVVPPILSPDESRVAFTTAEGRALHVYDVETGKEVSAIRLTGRTAIQSMQFSADGKRLLTGDDWGNVQVWAAGNGTLLRTTRAHRASVYRFDSSSDQRFYSTSSRDGSAQIWDAQTDLPASPLLAGGGGGVSDFSADVSRFATPGFGSSASRIWDVRTGLPLTDLIRGDGPQTGNAYYSPDGRFVGLKFTEAIQFWPASIEAKGGRIPDWLLRLATVCGAQRLDDEGRVVSATDEVARMVELRREIAGLPEDAPYVAWARWLLDDSPTRSIGPAFTITPADARKLAEEMAREQAALAAAAKVTAVP